MLTVQRRQVNWGQGRSHKLRNQARRALPACCNACGACDTPLQLDHITNLAAGGTNHISNVQWLCRPCHHDKTQREAAAGRAHALAARGTLSRRNRDQEPHPGSITAVQTIPQG